VSIDTNLKMCGIFAYINHKAPKERKVILGECLVSTALSHIPPSHFPLPSYTHTHTHTHAPSFESSPCLNTRYVAFVG
jgi:hypothetical protein